MKKIRLIIPLLMVIFISSTLPACGFRPRSPNDVPPQLRILYLDAHNPYDPLVVQLSRTLRALNVHLTQTREAAPVTLRVSHISWETAIPTILYSSNATTYSYTLSVDFVVETRDGRTIKGPRNLTLIRSLLQNPNQVYTPNAAHLMKQEMTRTMVTLIYNYLVAGLAPPPPRIRKRGV
ncbi:hypothetical protein FIV31_01320 [Coxiella endosymbiont of Ornithodoros amblus]|uniref:LPS-assembly lipoprotein LptE n=1 Tax=Coxiella endosymbiont of Ornithodoros amblus TaxID=1656166 RepID=UPI00244E2DAA|nr:LPS assembly lipoprotein LptE [Coxiella endosymbiont of Ornithodoros amblus]MBW5802390.1 hypothetical protein [Coxiella endosymbiont of Ornithodoros amblus]